MSGSGLDNGYALLTQRSLRLYSLFSLDRVSEKHSQFVKKHTATELSVAHYTGRIIYDTRAFTDINRDFVPPEMIETFRSSLDESIMLMFTNQLTKAGNLTMPFETVQHKDETERKSYVS